jgi:biotin transport system substrate-specific component
MRHHRSLTLDSHNATFFATALRADSPVLVVTTRVAAVLLMTVLTAAAAQFSMPLWFTPVPFTVQPMVVLLGGALLGPWLGAASQLLYLALGLAGVPVFAASAILPQGPARLVGPTGGYLMSYPLAAFVSGWLAMRGFDRRYLTSVLAMAAGLVVVFVGGVLWLAQFTSPAGHGIPAALEAGFYPFVVADLFKLCVAASILPALWRFTGLGRRA